MPKNLPRRSYAYEMWMHRVELQLHTGVLEVIYYLIGIDAT